MHSSANVDRIDLDVPEVPQRGIDARQPAVDPMRPPQEGAGLFEGELSHSTHGPGEGRVGWDRTGAPVADGGTEGAAAGATEAGLARLTSTA